MEDRIGLALDGDPVLLEAAETHRDYLAAETLALSLALGNGAIEAAGASEHAQQARIEGRELLIALRRDLGGDRGRG